jgi:class 3 adenylate cyclase
VHRARATADNRRSPRSLAETLTQRVLGGGSRARELTTPRYPVREPAIRDPSTALIWGARSGTPPRASIGCGIDSWRNAPRAACVQRPRAVRRLSLANATSLRLFVAGCRWKTSAVAGIRYARTGEGVNIAYKTDGQGPPDVVVIPGWASHVEVFTQSGFVAPVASFARLIWFDKRGTGASDAVPVDRLPTLEQRMDDVRAVLDAVGSEKAALFGVSEGGPMAILYAATYPERVTSLILYGTYASWDWETSPWRRYAATPDDFEAQLLEHWSEGYPGVEFWKPSAVGVPGAAEGFALGQQIAASPAAAAGLFRMSIATDVRAVLPTLRVPTLVAHQVGDRVCDVEGGRYLARSIPGARYVELPGNDHAMDGTDLEQFQDEVVEFLTGTRPAPHVDRALSTVLFTDIVESTGTAASMGDGRWRHVLDEHDKVVTQEVMRHRGRVVKQTGDGFLATFDGPARAVRCACAIRDAVRPLGIEIRAGIHTGEVELRADDIGGIAVHLGARVAALASANQVLVSRTVVDLVVGSGIRFENFGEHKLKGVPGDWLLYLADANDRHTET